MRSLSLLVVFSHLVMGCPSEPSGPDVPGSDVPSVDAPAIDTPGLDAPALDVPGLDTPGGDAPGLDVPAGGDTPSGADGGRTIVMDRCARVFGMCNEDGDCRTGGCGAEVCASEDVGSTCDCTAPRGSCGCVDGLCAWYR